MTGLVVGTTVFFEAGVVILIPLAFGLARKTKKSTLLYVIPLLAGLATGFAFIPPSAGSVLAIVLIPLVLILCSTVSEYMPVPAPARPVLEFLGTPFVALIIAVLAMTMAAGIMASMPAVSGLSPLYLAAMVCAINGGSTAFSHVNDSGFWLVSSLLEIDEKTTLKSWTVMETIIGVTGLACAVVISLFA